MTHAILPTKNESWGFFGTLRERADRAEAWALAVAAIEEAACCRPEAARDFLDSREGRHFADDALNGLSAGLSLSAAIGAATNRWMAWTTSRALEKARGIPAGLPYLTGLVHALDLELEETP